MPSQNSTLPALWFLPSIPSPSHNYAHRLEREISRDALIDVAPDRESLLASDKSTEEIRQLLKLRVLSDNANKHWLYHSRTRVDVRLRNTTIRMSTFTERAKPNENKDLQSNIHIVRRVFSASSMFPHSPATMSSIDDRLSPNGVMVADIWGSAKLSTLDKLISPRPLGPTHILIAFAASQSQPINGTSSPNCRDIPSTFPELVEVPINDLLFILNAPNLASLTHHATGTTSISSPLPRRLHKELPRVLMHVPHLKTFPELVVYLHTKNLSELFRKIIPEWIRDLIHPLPSVPIEHNSHPSLGEIGLAKKLKHHRPLFGLRISDSESSSSIESIDSALSYIRPLRAAYLEPGPERTVENIGIDIAEALHSMSLAGLHHLSVAEIDPLITVTSSLDALRDNLEYVGYFGKSLWIELEISRDILIRAVSWKAKMDRLG